MSGSGGKLNLMTGTSSSGNGRFRQRRLALAKAIVSDKPILDSPYKDAILNLRLLAREAEEQGAQGGHTPNGPGEAVDTLFSYAEVQTALFPDEQSDFYASWQYLRGVAL